MNCLDNISASPVPVITHWENLENHSANLEIYGQEPLFKKRIAPKANSLNEPEKIKPIDSPTAKMRNVLGNYGIDRLCKFAELKSGLDFGRGKALSPASLGMLEFFLQKYTALEEAEPSIFLTQDGNLQLEWEDKKGNHVEVEFFYEYIEYFLSATGEEGEYNLNEIEKFISILEELEG